MLFHDRFVTVSDERDGDARREFLGVRLGAVPAGDATVNVFVFVDDSNNGFGVAAPGVIALKHLGDGKYGA